MVCTFTSPRILANSPESFKCLWWQRWCGASLGGGQSITLNLTLSLRLFSGLFTLHVTSYEDYDTKTNYVNWCGELLTLLGAWYFWINLPEGFFVPHISPEAAPRCFQSIHQINVENDSFILPSVCCQNPACLHGTMVSDTTSIAVGSGQ